MSFPSAAAERPSDRRFRRRWMLAALFLLVFPYALLALLTPALAPGGQYTGQIFNPSDTFLYLSQMLHGHLGEWTFTDYFTYLDLPSLPLFPLYLVIGHLLPGPAGSLSLNLAFQLWRLVIAVLFMQQAWKLYGELLPGRASRRVAFLFLLFTAGMGAYRAMLAWLPPPPHAPFDLDFIESSSFYGLLYAPHFAAALLLIVVYLRALFRATMTPQGSWRATAVGALAAAAVATIHPEKVGVLGIATVVFLAWRQLQRGAGMRHWVQGLVMVGGGVPYTLFVLRLTADDQQVKMLLHQGRPHLPPPDPWFYYPLGYGLPGLFAVLGLPRLIRRLREAPPGEALLWSMVLASVAILLAPWQALDHRAEGMQLAVAGLAGRNLVHLLLPRLWRTRAFAAAVRRRLLGYRRRRLRLLSLNLCVILSCPTVLALAFSSPRAALADSVEVYLNADDTRALPWLRTHARPSDIVLTGPFTAQFVAAYGGTHVVWGEWAFTPNFDAEGRRLVELLRGRTDARQYMTERHVTFVYFGPRERDEASGGTFEPARLPFLVPAYRTGGTVIYRVE